MKYIFAGVAFQEIFLDGHLALSTRRALLAIPNFIIIISLKYINGIMFILIKIGNFSFICALIMAELQTKFTSEVR